MLTRYFHDLYARYRTATAGRVAAENTGARPSAR